MADVPENLRAMLMATPAISAITQQRIFQDTVPQTSTEPYIWFQVRGTEDIYACMDDAQGIQPGLTTFDLECCAVDIDVAKALARAVRGLNKFRGLMGAQQVCGLFVENQSDEYVPYNDMSDRGSFPCALDVQIYIPVTQATP